MKLNMNRIYNMSIVKTKVIQLSRGEDYFLIELKDIRQIPKSIKLHIYKIWASLLIILCLSIFFFLDFSHPGIKDFLYGGALAFSFIGGLIHWVYAYNKSIKRSLPTQKTIWSRKFHIAHNTINIQPMGEYSIKSIGILLETHTGTSDLIEKIQKEKSQIKVKLKREEKGDYQKMILDFSFFLPIAITKDDECIPLIDWTYFSIYKQFPSLQKFLRERDNNHINMKPTIFRPLPKRYVQGTLYALIDFIDDLVNYYPRLRENTNYLIDDNYYVTKWTSGQKTVPRYTK